jgi:hypothetical protein
MPPSRPPPPPPPPSFLLPVWIGEEPAYPSPVLRRLRAAEARVAGRAALSRARGAVRAWGCDAARGRVARDAAAARRGLETLRALREAEIAAAERLRAAEAEAEAARRAAEAEAEAEMEAGLAAFGEVDPRELRSWRIAVSGCLRRGERTRCGTRRAYAMRYA